jgi:hypothetical protein
MIRVDVLRSVTEYLTGVFGPVRARRELVDEGGSQVDV